MSEQTRIEELRRALATSDPRVLLGVGDDAAVLAAPGEPLVWTVDAAVEGVHFRRDLMSLEDAGYRATMAAASDLAAMGAAPLGLLAALVLPVELSDEDFLAILAGQRMAAAELGAPLVGGNLARGSEISITTTALGHASSPITRAGARAGDVLAAAGAIGLAAAGLAAAQRRVAGSPAEALDMALRAFRRPQARIADGLRARGIARAAVDVSDGLAADVAHLTRNGGCTVAIDEGSLRTPELCAAAEALGADPLELALHGGEDYALLVALPPAASLEGFRRLGLFGPREGDADVILVGADGSRRSVPPRGFDHFAK